MILSLALHSSVLTWSCTFSNASYSLSSLFSDLGASSCGEALPSSWIVSESTVLVSSIFHFFKRWRVVYGNTSRKFGVICRMSSFAGCSRP